MATRPDNELLKTAFGFLMLAVVVVILWLASGCAPKREALAVYHETSVAAQQIAANLEAKDKGGKVYLVGDSASMAPTILPHDYVVAIPTPFADLQIGMVCNYKADWNNYPSTCHRIVAKWPDGSWLMEGDSEKNTSETHWSMRADNYIDHVISDYRFP